MVDEEILNILRMRFEDCMFYEGPDKVEKCTPLNETYLKATENWFIKCKLVFFLYSKIMQRRWSVMDISYLIEGGIGPVLIETKLQLIIVYF